MAFNFEQGTPASRTNVPKRTGFNFNAGLTEEQKIAKEKEARVAQGLPVSFREDRVDPTFLGNVVRGTLKPVARLSKNLVDAAKIAAGQDSKTLAKTNWKTKAFGDVSSVGTTGNFGKDVLDSIGVGAEIASTVAGGGAAGAVGKQAIKGAVRQGIKTGVRQGFRTGALYGAGSALQDQEGKTFGEIVGGAVPRAITSGLVGGATGGAVGGVLPAVRNFGVNQVKKAVPSLRASEVDNVIDNAYTKAVKPSVTGRKTLPRATKANENARQAFKAIVEEKDNIVLKDLEGGIKPRGAVPENLPEFAQAIDQLKSRTIDKIDERIAKSSKAGAVSDITDIIDSLKSRQSQAVGNPKFRQLLQEEIDALSEFETGKVTPVQLRNKIQDYNSQLVSFYTSGTEKAKSQLQSDIAFQLRKKLDDTVLNSTDEGVKDLRQLYASLSSIEKDVNSSVLREARKLNPAAIANATDVFTSGDILAGLITQNPALLVQGLTGRALRSSVSYLNNPNRLLRKAFEEVDSLYGKGVLKPAISARRAPLLMLPAPKSGTPRTIIRSNKVINLPARSQSTIDAQEMARIQSARPAPVRIPESLVPVPETLQGRIAPQRITELNNYILKNHNGDLEKAYLSAVNADRPNRTEQLLLDLIWEERRLRNKITSEEPLPVIEFGNSKKFNNELPTIE